LLKLIAPVDGTVQGLKVLTVGGVVPAAQELMTVVPDSGPIEADVSIESKDIGFVYLKQDAAVKIDAFEYTKYGLISGKVVRIARDAVQDEKRGLLYNAKVELAQNSMVVNGKTIILTPGMGVQVEIKTGSRRVIQYLLTPLLQHKRESLSER
jgi:hemolysin D